MNTLDPGVLAGDQAAIARFVDAVTPIIQARVARRLAPSGRALSGDLRQDVKDVTQDVFVYLFSDDARVLRKWDGDLGLSLANYVGLIAERRTISALRSGRSNPWREEAGVDEHSVGDGQRGIEHEVAEQDRFARLVDAMRDALSPQGWHLFELLYIQEREVAEVVDETGMTPDAVYAWRSRLRRTARQQFAKLEAADAPERGRSGS